jgi:hypothetical protein
MGFEAYSFSTPFPFASSQGKGLLIPDANKAVYLLRHPILKRTAKAVFLIWGPILAELRLLCLKEIGYPTPLNTIV